MADLCSREKIYRKPENAVHLAPITLEYLRTFGVPDDRELRIEFFFCSRTESSANALASELRNLNYEVETGKSAGNENLFLVNGWTTRLFKIGQYR